MAAPQRRGAESELFNLMISRLSNVAGPADGLDKVQRGASMPMAIAALLAGAAVRSTITLMQAVFASVFSATIGAIATLYFGKHPEALSMLTSWLDRFLS